MAPPKSLSDMFPCACCLRCLFNYSAEDIEKREQSRRIDKLLKQDEPKFRRLVKLLLLGAGESGKSTFLKQMKIIHGFKFDPVALEEYRGIIYQNVVQGMKVLVDARHKLGIPWEFPENDVHADVVMQFSNRYLPLDENSFLTFAGPVQVLWKDSGIKTAYNRRREFQLADSVRYFYDNLDRIARAVSFLFFGCKFWQSHTNIVNEIFSKSFFEMILIFPSLFSRGMCHRIKTSCMPGRRRRGSRNSSFTSVMCRFTSSTSVVSDPSARNGCYASRT